MKEDISSLVRKYFEGCIDAASLDEGIAASLPKSPRKRGQSMWLPSGESLEGMRFEHAELSRLHHDFKAKRIGNESCLLIIDLVTMHRENLAEGGSVFVDEIDGIGTPEDLEVWQRQPPL
jgi:hypothetical protein